MDPERSVTMIPVAHQKLKHAESHSRFSTSNVLISLPQSYMRVRWCFHRLVTKAETPRWCVPSQHALSNLTFGSTEMVRVNARVCEYDLYCLDLAGMLQRETFAKSVRVDCMPYSGNRKYSYCGEDG